MCISGIIKTKDLFILRKRITFALANKTSRSGAEVAR